MAKSAKIRKGRAYLYKQEYVPRSAPCPTPHKVAHPDRARAKKARRQQERSRHDVSLHVYRCSCGCFHVGTMEHAKTREQARAIAQRKLDNAA